MFRYITFLQTYKPSFFKHVNLRTLSLLYTTGGSKRAAFSQLTISVYKARGD